MSSTSNTDNRRLVMSAELLTIYNSNNQPANQKVNPGIDGYDESNEQKIAQLNELEDSANYVLGYN